MKTGNKNAFLGLDHDVALAECQNLTTATQKYYGTTDSIQKTPIDKSKPEEHHKKNAA